MKEITMTTDELESALDTAMRSALKALLDRHDKSRAKISSQCDTLISKKLVEDMIKELE